MTNKEIYNKLNDKIKDLVDKELTDNEYIDFNKIVYSVKLIVDGIKINDTFKKYLYKEVEKFYDDNLKLIFKEIYKVYSTK